MRTAAHCMRILAVTGLVASQGGCSADIDASAGGGGAPAGRPGNGTPAGAAPGSPGAPAGTPGSPDRGGPPAPPAAFRPAAATLRRLTVRQYGNSMRDLLGAAARVPAALEPDVRLDGLVAVGASRLSLSTRATEQFETAALDLAQQALAEPAWRMANVPCVPAATVDDRCAREFIKVFGARAWRRPLTADEIARWAGIATNAAQLGGDFWRGLGWGVSGLLQSPYFLYRAELGAPDPADPSRKRLDGYELASRMSYFLWDSTPDDMLLAAAGGGQLMTQDGVRTQTQRLLASPRARAALQGFFADRLRLDELDDTDHPIANFPKMTATLLDSMAKETLAVVDDLVFGQDADIRQFLDGAATFLNDDLASLYGMAKPGKGAALVKTTLPANSPRAGYFGQASFLALASHQTATSPTRRGKFLREVLLCQTIPAPPPDTNPVLPQDAVSARRTMRERLEAHRADPTCRSCHALVDPVGLAFENFDAIGGFRTMDGGQPINPAGDLDGAAFADAAGLARLVRERPEAAQCLVQGLHRYATGHIETDGEEPALVTARATFAAAGFRFRALVQATVDSPAFRYVALTSP